MSTQHTGDESQIEESSSADHYEEVPLGTMERSLPALNHFSIDAADLYSDGNTGSTPSNSTPLPPS